MKALVFSLGVLFVSGWATSSFNDIIERFWISFKSGVVEDFESSVSIIVAGGEDVYFLIKKWKIFIQRETKKRLISNFNQ